LAPSDAQPMIVERVDTRTNLFVLAILYTPSASAPVRVRNASKSGLLIEAPALPRKGTAVKIERGSETATGTIVWNYNGRAGVKLSSSLEVEKWLPRAGRCGQSRVDEIFHGLKSGTLKASSATCPGDSVGDTRADLKQLAAELATLGHDFAKDEHLIRSCAEELQRFEMLILRLNALAEQYPKRS
jgi:hypothetical protein